MPAIATVRIMVRIPEEMSEITGSREKDIAGNHGDSDQCCNYLILACRRNDDGKEHAVQSDAQCTYNVGRQDITHNNTEKCTETPARNGNRHHAIIVKRI